MHLAKIYKYNLLPYPSVCSSYLSLSHFLLYMCDIVSLSVCSRSAQEARSHTGLPCWSLLNKTADATGISCLWVCRVERKGAKSCRQLSFQPTTGCLCEMFISSSVQVRRQFTRTSKAWGYWPGEICAKLDGEEGEGIKTKRPARTPTYA